LRDPDFGLAFLGRRADRLLFGTDYYDLAQKAFDLFAEFAIAVDKREAIARSNARRLLFGD
jgi:predicted TIM-barrel fold metal-dependent hydrolase